MITRTNDTGGTFSQADYSDCEAYRYSLKRIWNVDGARVNFVMLNPSKADEIKNDPTVERCEQRARRLSFGAFQVTNIFAWRDTDPMALRRAVEPIGPQNDEALLEAAAKADQVVAAWGVHGAHLSRGLDVERLLRDAGCDLYHLGLTKDGHPRHPLYLPYARQPQLWDAV